MKEKNQNCSNKQQSCKDFQLEAVLSLDERGQIVIPKDVRESAGIRPGEKLTLVSWKCDDETCCLVLIRAEKFSGLVKTILNPLTDSFLKE